MVSPPRAGAGWYSYACGTLLGAIVLGNFGRWLFLDGHDAHRCGSLLARGSWSDPETHTQWQPEGCYHAPLKPDDYLQCLTMAPSNARDLELEEFGENKRRIVFIGDSTIRTLFGGFLRKIYGPNRQIIEPNYKHSNQLYTLEDGDNTLTMEFWWDQFLNTSAITDLVSGQSDQPPVSLLVISSGLHQMRLLGDQWMTRWAEEVDNVFCNLTSIQGSPGRPLINPWDATTFQVESGTFEDPGVDLGLPSVSGPIVELIEQPDMTLEPVDVSDTDSIYGHGSNRRIARSVVPSFPIADATIFMPTVDPVERMLTNGRGKTLRHARARKMHAHLAKIMSRPDPAPIAVSWATLAMAHEDESIDGIHHTNAMADRQAEVLLGWRCNDVIRQGTPSGTCCKRYNWVTPVQGILLLILALYGPLGTVLKQHLAPTSRLSALLPPASISDALCSFGLACVYLFLADRTPIFLKENKVYDSYVVGGWMLGALLVGLATMRKGKDGGFLHRDITDEWKGWMQIAILIYHFFGASKVSSIYNPIRVMVAAYLFMTGYGHFFFYYKKADFGFRRVATVLVRLNLLSIVLPYVMDTDYLFYYFAPLVSWWYLTIYATMAVGCAYNQRTWFLLTKLLASASLMTLLIKHSPWIMNDVFAILNVAFRHNWDAKEWSFRLVLDLLIVWCGMLSAFIYIKAQEAKITERAWFNIARYLSAGVSFLALGWYAYFELHHQKYDYNAYHPYISIIPIIAFVVLRNLTPTLRSYTSGVFCFIGQCSLETFTLQFHGFLASDTHAILMVIPGTSWRPLNVVLSTIVFIWLSHMVSGATGTLTDYIVGKKERSISLPLPASINIRRSSGSEPSSPCSETALLADSEYDQEMALAEKALINSPLFEAPSRQEGAIAKVSHLAGENLAVRMGLIGLGLGALNWIY
ncbi:10 TM acyl transferase domain found in Cas1p-domain-containing protein [Kockovaella imperatae]|uniref:10 TM acyl transferase domain found in Cas1p-domain-containing protein n=1 Tax=Kockovaella imperatae TaxID=4999 RepID=A0A1Y1UQU3_9TREE|nr:10 TM acyl transferase domain found in Cas1p-domain-containing protein [Kockovaella imperatae]ORX39947.1 10 TM acyl transferase domain found in Cas1p-domain-containing protein [Kockovaella imperatae]